MVRFILCLWLIIIPFSRETDIRAQEALIRTYTLSDGLVMNRIRGFHQDAQGFIWIFTWDGLSRNEGYQFRNYVSGKELSHSLINGMLENRDETLYVALNDGTLEVIKDQAVQPQLRRKGIIINVFFRDERGNILTGTDYNGVCLFENGNIKPVSDLDPDIAIHTAVVKNDMLFMASTQDLLIAKIIYRGKTISHIQTIQQWNYLGEYIKCVFMDRNEDIFIGTRDGLRQLVPFGHSNNKFELVIPDFVSINTTWKNWFPQTMIQSDDGTYWIGTDNGLIRMKNKNDWSVFTTSDNLPSNLVNSLFIDSNKTLWIGTDLGVASMNLINSISRHNLSCGSVKFFLPAPSGEMYGICENQFVYSFTSTGLIKSLLEEQSFSFELLPYQENVFLVYAGGVRLMRGINPIHIINQTSSTKNGTIFNNLIYALAYEGLYRCTSEGYCKLLSGVDYRIEAFCSSGNKLLIGTWNDGLHIARPGKNDSMQLDIISNFDHLLPGKEIRSLMVSKNGDIWVGTRYHGISRLVCDPELNNCNVQTYTIKDGMIGNWITCMAEDRYGNIWVGSMSGIDKLIPKGEGYRVFSYSRIFGFYDALHHISISTEGTIWAAISSGFARITDGMIDTLSPPDAYITEVLLGGSEPILTDKPVSALSYNKNNIKFAFSAPEFISEKQLKFSYRLFGSPDTLWSAPTTNHELFFSNLQPGNYRFEVAAIGWNGKTGRPVSYRFIIRPPVWRQSWFVSLVVLLVGASLYALYRFRIAQIKRVQSVRDRIASDLHDEIGSSLSHINILAEIGKQSIAQSGKPVEILDRIGVEVQNSSEALDDIIWSVKTRWDSFEDVIARMRQYATEILEPTGITFRIRENISVDSQLDMEFKRDLFLVYKEILRNIIRHANATNVEIEIGIENRIVKLVVTDDGSGFNVAHPTQRSGLNNIRLRSARWKGSATWNSSPRSGTSVEVIMKTR